MNRVLLVFFAVFTLVARSDGTLKCYMCSTLSDPSCEDPSKDVNSPPVECALNTINDWNTKMQMIQAFRPISKIFDVDHPQQINQKVADVACAKMTLKVGNTNVTLRSCQSAKSPTLDVCHAIREQLASASGYAQANSMSFCDLCSTDGCNGAVDVAAPKMINLFFGSVVLLLVQAYRHRFA